MASYLDLPSQGKKTQVLFFHGYENSCKGRPGYEAKGWVGLFVYRESM